MCAQVLAKAGNTDAPQAHMLLGESISATEKVKETASSLLSNAKKSLDQLQKMFPAVGSSPKCRAQLPVSGYERHVV